MRVAARADKPALRVEPFQARYYDEVSTLHARTPKLSVPRAASITFRPMPASLAVSHDVACQSFFLRPCYKNRREERTALSRLSIITQREIMRYVDDMPLRNMPTFVDGRRVQF